MAYSGKIHEVRRDATEPLGKDERGVLAILRNPCFNVGTRDSTCAEYRTANGDYGQVCKPLRGPGFYVRGPHADNKTHQSIDAALSAAMADAT